MGFPVSPRNRANPTTKAQKGIKNNGLLMNLPAHIILEILSWLPVKTIFQCKSVCRLWKELINEPAFVQMHFSRARPGMVVHHSEMFKNYFKLVDFEDAIDHHGIPHDRMIKFKLNTLSSYPDANIVVDGSVHGLLFARDINYKHETLYVCNPHTHEYIQLPRPDRVARYPGVVTHGFGVTPSTGEYKVVRIFHDRVLNPRNGSLLRVPQSECHVYTLGSSRAWRSAGPAPFAYDSRLIGLFFKGNIHWLVQDLEGHELISCFDLENEKFKPFPGPFPGRKLLGSLGVLRDRLCLCDNSPESNIEIWIMKEYGVEKSWTKEIIIKKMPELAGPSFEIVHALKVFRDGTILVLWGDFFMLYCCSKSGGAKEVDMDQARGPNSIEAIHYVPSFLSLKRFVIENVSMF